MPGPSGTLAERLGLGAARGIVLHVDDLGLCRGANQAFLDLATRGLVTCGSVMVPCPAFGEIAEAAAADPGLDLGVHLTLTSEWAEYRWAPLSTRSPASGLVDGDGYLWRDVESLRRHLVVEAAAAELRAQVEAALAAGLRPTHLDAHMAAAWLPGLLEVHLDLAEEYGLVPVIPRGARFAPDAEAYRAALARLDAAGCPVPDAIRGTLAVPPAEAAAGYQRMIEALPAGVTHAALHCTLPGEIEAIAPQHAPWRTTEHALLADCSVARWCAAAGVVPVGYRAIQALRRGA